MNSTDERLTVRNSSLLGDAPGHRSSYHLLSCAARAQAVASILEETDQPSEQVLPETNQALELLVKQLRHLGYSLPTLNQTDGLEALFFHRPVDLVRLLDEVVERVKGRTPQSRFLKLYEPQLCRVWGNASQLQIVVNNLISNALTFSAPPTPIIISAETCRALTERENGRMVVSITSYGAYIPPEEQDKIFTKFYQRETEQASGQGLGLYLSRRLIQLHDGQLEVESSPAEETTFWFTLPLAQAHIDRRKGLT